MPQQSSNVDGCTWPSGVLAYDCQWLELYGRMIVGGPSFWWEQPCSTRRAKCSTQIKAHSSALNLNNTTAKIGNRASDIKGYKVWCQEGRAEDDRNTVQWVIFTG